MTKTFPDLNSLLIDLEETPWVEPETRAEASIRLLHRLSTLPSIRWNQLHWGVRKWYDRCYEALHKSQELFTYPILEVKAFNHVEFLENKAGKAPILKRISELLLIDPTLTGDKIHEILQLEGFKPKLAACRVAVASMQTLIAYMHEKSYVNINLIYKSDSNATE